ncbi:MAG: hypothetical protein Q9166_007460 [cf. Caloplaca sp. 2 TL-2023]
MDDFEGMGMSSYIESSMPMSTVDAEAYHGVLPSIGLTENIPASYDTSDFGMTDDLSFMQPSLPAYQNPYEQDPFPDTAALMDMMPPEDAASIDRDNKLLSFQPPSYNFTLLDISLRRTGVSIAAQLHGMFFMAEAQDQGPTGSSASATELTCYRRNLFQITGSITLPRSLRYIMTDAGDRIPILGQELCISATESVEGHPVKLISVPWKTPISNNTVTPDDKTEKEPVTVLLDTMSNQDMDADFATFPFAWKRLQFRIATANNGRRKELQQHFVVRLKLVATLSTGARVSICEARSGAIIVRGRSPRNFQQRKDLPVGTNSIGTNNRRTVPPPPPLTRNSTTESGHHLKTEKSPDRGHTTLDNQDLQTPSTFGEWGRKPGSGSISRISTVPPPAFQHSSARSISTASTTPPRPKALSLSDSPERDTVHPRSAKAARIGSAPSMAPMMTNPAFLSPHGDSADLLYEYFPLGLDDWQPPVDAVYRPHVVHHMGPHSGSTPGERHGRPSLGGRSKRYFSEDQSKAV